MKRFLLSLILCFPVFASTTTISDTLTSTVGGAAWTGRIQVEINAPGNAQPLYAGSVSLAGYLATYCIGVQGSGCTATTAAGVVNIVLWPTDQITPAGTSYKARYTPASGTAYTETWVVPTGATTLAAIRATTVPTPTVLFSLSQIRQGGATTGQCLAWNGAAWAPASCGTGGGSTWDDLGGTTWDDLQ